jgi:hypothetical protein
MNDSARQWNPWRGRPHGAYRSLDAPKIVETAGALRVRITERFPSASLARIAGEVEVVAQESVDRAAWCAAPHWGVRAVAIALTLLGLFLLIRLSMNVPLSTPPQVTGISDLLQLVYNVVNDLILIGLALIFVWGAETRVKRARALKALHELRSLAHIVDMHQLTKDPESLLRSRSGAEHDKATMTRSDLFRYLLYCSDLLALLSKIAALFAQELADATVLSAVNEIEELSTALSQKIWQKITLVDLEPKRVHGGSG